MNTDSIIAHYLAGKKTSFSDERVTKKSLSSSWTIYNYCILSLVFCDVFMYYLSLKISQIHWALIIVVCFHLFFFAYMYFYVLRRKLVHDISFDKWERKCELTYMKYGSFRLHKAVLEFDDLSFSYEGLGYYFDSRKEDVEIFEHELKKQAAVLAQRQLRIFENDHMKHFYMDFSMMKWPISKIKTMALILAASNLGQNQSFDI